MNLSQSELPLTSFWDYIPGSSRTSSKKETAESSRPTGKRKRGSDNAKPKPKPEPSGKGKRKGAKDVISHRKTPKKPSRVYGAPRASTSKVRQLALGSTSQPRTSQSVEVLDLTSSPNSPDTGARNLKQRRVDKGTPGDHPFPFDTHTHASQAFPSPPQTHFSRKLTAWPITTRGQPNAPGPLPTPGTSVPRLRNRAKPSQMSKITIPSAPNSPLASRRGAAIMPLASSSPLSPCLIDIQPLAGDSNAEALQQALRDVAPKSRNSDLLGRGDADDDPFATSAVIPSSITLSNNSSPRSIVSVAHIEKTSPIIPILSPSNRPQTMQPPHLTDLIVSPSKCIIESSQSQFLLPFADSPRRKQHSHPLVVSSSQSQILLPFADSPRRMRGLFAPAMQNNGHFDMCESVQIVASSQSQTEKELRLSSPHIGLFALPDITSTTEANDSRLDDNHITGNITLPLTAPRTPCTKGSPKRRSLYSISSPISSPRHHSSPIARLSQMSKTFTKEPSPMSEEVDVTIRPKNDQVQSTSRYRNRSSTSQKAATDDSATESESESVMIEFLTKRKPRAEQSPLTEERRASSLARVDNSFGSVTEYSLAPNSSPLRIQSNDNPSQWSSEDTQALYLAGAPLSVSDFSLRMIGTDDDDDSTHPMPPAVRNFMDMFDSDDSSYPRDFPMELRC